MTQARRKKLNRAGKMAAAMAFIPLIMLISGSGVQAQITLPDDRSSTLQLLLMLTILSLLPSILIMMTSFTRIIIVLSFVRNALGTQNTPPNQVLIGLSMFLTFFFMAPVFDEINTNAYQPYVSGQMEQDEAIDEAMKPLRTFMGKQTNTTDLEMFMEMSGIPSVESFDDIPSSVLIPAFMTSELKQAFQLGFFIFIPFLVIDMIVASTLMSMGMMMLPPTVISLPFKILLFVLVDGWDLVIKTLFNSFN
ncbi:MAG: flagellar biosynthesis protein FliP [Clostridiales bacterium]|jgi:flagellar biosynthetic protein FliP|nr:flagellar biosynthesis protein FliP [Clostridiales bacterium]